MAGSRPYPLSTSIVVTFLAVVRITRTVRRSRPSHRPNFDFRVSCSLPFVWLPGYVEFDRLWSFLKFWFLSLPMLYPAAIGKCWIGVTRPIPISVLLLPGWSPLERWLNCLSVANHASVSIHQPKQCGLNPLRQTPKPRPEPNRSVPHHSVTAGPTSVVIRSRAATANTTPRSPIYSFRP